jgi:hypothetical protein
MSRKQSLRKKFNQQKSCADARGIELQLTFEQWVTWWGDDIKFRGKRAGQLQMQRFRDQGPYAIGNIKKGTPQQNAKTAGALRRNRSQTSAAERHQRDLDACIYATSLDVATESEEIDSYSSFLPEKVFRFGY